MISTSDHELKVVGFRGEQYLTDGYGDFIKSVQRQLIGRMDMDILAICTASANWVEASRAYLTVDL